MTKGEERRDYHYWSKGKHMYSLVLPTALLVMKLLAGKHSSLGSVNIAGSNYGLFLDRDFMWHVVVALQVKGVFCCIHILLWPSCVIPHSHPFSCLDCGCPIHQSVLRPVYLQIVDGKTFL